MGDLGRFNWATRKTRKARGAGAYRTGGTRGGGGGGVGERHQQCDTLQPREREREVGGQKERAFSDGGLCRSAGQSVTQRCVGSRNGVVELSR